MASKYRTGEYNVICDRCGVEKKNTQVRKEWTGLIVCFDCFDYRQPQDFVRGVRDDMAVPFARPDPPDNYYVDTTTYSVYGRLLASVGTAAEGAWDTSNAVIVELTDGALASATEAEVLPVEAQAQDFAPTIIA